MLVSSLDREKPIGQAPGLLVTAVARTRNTGMKYSEDMSELLEVGEAPLLMEPVEAWITLRRPGLPAVRALDHAGRRTEQLVPVETDGAASVFKIHAGYKTVYYEVEYA